MRKTILVSSISPTYSQEQPEHSSWQPFAVQQQQEGPTTETPPGQQQQQQQQQETDDDPFKGLNLENADDATKAQIEKIRLSHANLAKSNKEAADKLERVTKAASNYQSQADRAHQILKRHNLDTADPNKVVNPQKSAEETLIEATAAEYVKRGMKPEQAQQWAEMMSVAIQVARPGILNEVGTVLGPAITQLNTINGDRYLNAFGSSAESQVAFKIPGVYEGAKAIVDQMIANKIQVTEVGVQNAIQMAVGEALMKAGGDLTKLQETLKGAKPTTPVTPPTTGPSILATLFGGNLNGNGHYVMPVDNNGKRTPVAANEHTAQAALICGQMMDRQIKQSN